MSDDLIRKIEDLINSAEGDTKRLQQIQNILKNGEELNSLDKEYVEDLISNKISSENLSNSEAYSNDIPLSNIPTEENKDLNSSSSVKSIPTKKYAIVGIAITIVFIAYVGLDLYAVNMLQFRPHSGQQVAISPTEISIQSDVCNPSYFPATFKKYEIVAYYQSAEIENATISGTTISPKSAAILDGIFALNRDTISKFAGQKLTFNVTEAHIITKVDAPIFGLIPYSLNKEYAADEFQKGLRNGSSASYSC